MVPVVDVDHAPATAFAMEADTLTPGLSILPNQLGSASCQGVETPPTVSDHVVYMIVDAN